MAAKGSTPKKEQALEMVLNMIVAATPIGISRPDLGDALESNGLGNIHSVSWLIRMLRVAGHMIIHDDYGHGTPLYRIAIDRKDYAHWHLWNLNRDCDHLVNMRTYLVQSAKTFGIPLMAGSYPTTWGAAATQLLLADAGLRQTMGAFAPGAALLTPQTQVVLQPTPTPAPPVKVLKRRGSQSG